MTATSRSRVGLVGAEDRTERANADLMQHPEGAELLAAAANADRVVSGQGVPQVGSKKFNTFEPPLDSARSRAIRHSVLLRAPPSHLADL